MIFNPSSLLNRGVMSSAGLRMALSRNGVSKFGHEKEDLDLLTNLNPKGFYHLNQNQHWNAFYVDSRLAPEKHLYKHKLLANQLLACSVPYVLITSFSNAAKSNTTEVLFQRNPEIVFDHTSAPMAAEPFVLHADDGDEVWELIAKLADKNEFVCSLMRKSTYDKTNHIGTMSCTLSQNFLNSSGLGQRILDSVARPLPGLSVVICENADKTTTLELRMSS